MCSLHISWKGLLKTMSRLISYSIYCKQELWMNFWTWKFVSQYDNNNTNQPNSPPKSDVTSNHCNWQCRHCHTGDRSSIFRTGGRGFTLQTMKYNTGTWMTLRRDYKITLGYGPSKVDNICTVLSMAVGSDSETTKNFKRCVKSW